MADDLTGAGDCAVTFAESGWDTELVIGRAPVPRIARGSVRECYGRTRHGARARIDSLGPRAKVVELPADGGAALPMRWTAPLGSAQDPGPDVVVITPPPATADAPVHFSTSRLVAERLAEAVAGVVTLRPIQALVLVSGDGALAMLDRLGVTSIRVDHAAAEGVPVGVARGGTMEGMTVMTKSGGFGDSALLRACR